MVNYISLVDYQDLLAHAHNQKAKLADYYKKHIQGHTLTEYQEGANYTEDARTLFENNERLQKSRNFSQWVLKEFSNIVENNTHTTCMEHVQSAIQLANAVDAYSDWYKDYYGRRPTCNGEIF